MLNKILIATMIFAAVGCTSNQSENIPAEFAGAGYMLSDSDAQKWVVASHQVEQCIYPMLTRIQKEHFSKEDTYVYSQYVFFYPLEQVIGEEYVKIVQQDEKSMGYATHLYKKFRDLSADNLPDDQCQTLRTKARDDLAVLKGEHKTGMVTETKKAESSGNGDKTGIATTENRFFFDIIKWGSVLLL